MEGKDVNEESCPKPDEGNVTKEPALPDGHGTAGSPSNETETSDEMSVSNKNDIETTSPKPILESADDALDNDEQKPDAVMNEETQENTSKDGTVYKILCSMLWLF